MGGNDLLYRENPQVWVDNLFTIPIGKPTDATRDAFTYHMYDVVGTGCERIYEFECRGDRQRRSLCNVLDYVVISLFELTDLSVFQQSMMDSRTSAGCKRKRCSNTLRQRVRVFVQTRESISYLGVDGRNSVCAVAAQTLYRTRTASCSERYPGERTCVR